MLNSIIDQIEFEFSTEQAQYLKPNCATAV